MGLGGQRALIFDSQQFRPGLSSGTRVWRRGVDALSGRKKHRCLTGT
jgi:hypothetical protein